MENIAFQSLPSKYELLKEQIQDKDIKEIYSKFNFLFFSFDHNLDDIIFENYLFDYLKKFKFITYNISNIESLSTSYRNFTENNDITESKIIDITICVEGKSLMIEKINFSAIIKVINNLKSQNISIMNVSSKKNNIIEKSKPEITAEEEIENFCRHFKNKIKNNIFYNQTINSIVGYLIRRYYYPTNYFENDSFFTFLNKTNSHLIGKSIQNELQNFLFNENEPNSKFKKVAGKIAQIESTEFVDLQDFKESDFVILRNLYTTKHTTIYLVIHLKSLYVFAMKIMIDENNHEIKFCKNNSSRYFTKFYGFVKRNEKIIGFVYEFMSNSSILAYVLSNKEKINNLFVLNTMNRIVQGIEYLQSNSLIHRDLKPDNILVDHDFNSYISDFETIRQIANEDENMTADVGSLLYSSPEQYIGDNVSYPTDIYSFGLIAYFLIEKVEMTSHKKVKYQNSDILFKNKDFENLKKLINRCIRLSISDRPKIQEIKSNIINEIHLFNYLEKYLIKEKVNMTKVIQFIFESICIQNENQELLNKYFDRLKSYRPILLSKFNEDDSSFLYQLGNFYNKENHDFTKAKHYLEKAAELNNVNAFNDLGDIYRDGRGVKQDFSKAKEYYEIAANQNNDNAYNKLGFLYKNGFGVKQDYSKARYYFELAAEQNNSYSLNYLGDLYKEGKGVKQDYSKAKEYFEKSAKMNNPEAFNNIGYLYEKGYGVEQDYLKAKEYYELAAKENNSYALNYLGNLYENGYGVQRNFLKAKEYYEQSAKLNNSSAYCYLAYIYYNGYGVCRDLPKALKYIIQAADLNNSTALNNLGKIYFHGFGVKQDYLKAKKYYELAIKQNNSSAFINLAYLYEKGYGVDQNYVKAKELYELSASQNNSIAFFKLGNLYRKCQGVKQDYYKALNYYFLSEQLNNLSASFYLGYLFSIGGDDAIRIDISKSIHYYLKCCKTHTERQNDNNSTDNHLISIKVKNNKYYYRSLNDLGLIYKFYFDDIEKTEFYIKEAAFGEYPYGQNNYGLLNQFYLDQKENAIYFFEKSSKNKFALAFFNLANIQENDGENKESIQNYIKASTLENEPLIFQNHHHKDKRLEISKMFIICYTNLKLTEYFCSQLNFEESKSYFIKSLSKLILESHQFHFKFCKQNHFSYLKEFILNFPVFNIENQINSCELFTRKFEINQIKLNEIDKMELNQFVLMKNIENEVKIEKVNDFIDEEITFDNPELLFDYIIKNNILLKDFIDEIKSILEIMKTILYTPPYSILFGRINLEKKSEKTNITQKNINDSFYDGFQLNE